MPGILGTAPTTSMVEKRTDFVARRFVSSALIPVGSPVQLASTGLVAPLSSGTHIGTAWNGTPAVGDEVTVDTRFTHIVRCKVKAASTTLAIGDPVKLDATTATEVVIEKAVSTNLAVGIALAAGAATTYVEIGMVAPFTV